VTAGYWAPMPPSRTGVADYAAALLVELRRWMRVRVNASGDVNLYHIGNNELHRGIYARALSEPGVVILHDAVLHHFLLGSLDEAAYLGEFRHNYGTWAEDTARRLWAGRARSGADAAYFRYPMLRRLAERSRAVVVHNPAAGAMVRAHCAEARVHVVPHLLIPRPAPAAYEVARLRAGLGVEPHVLLFGVFGHLRESKRIASIVRAFHRARELAEVRLLIAGDFVSADYRRSIEALLADGAILRRPHLSEADFALHAAAIDACVSLRSPSAGETSGITVHMMGIGKAVVLTASEENDYPDEACIRISPGIGEEEELAAQMVRLAEHRNDVRAMGVNAAAYIARVHDASAAARRIKQILHSCYDECSISAHS
jgi:glycosyltransferase involved in cell wall biosynthesis